MPLADVGVQVQVQFSAYEFDEYGVRPSTVDGHDGVAAALAAALAET
jgi:hypothetical protein